MKDVKLYIEDILESIFQIEKYVEKMRERDFVKDTKTQDSVIRRLEIIGEAVKNLPRHFKNKHPEVPWREIAGTRDVLIHEYSGINLKRVWRTIKKDIPDLKKKIKNF